VTRFLVLGVGFQGQANEDLANFEVLRDDAMATIFLVFYILAAHWRHLANTTEPSVCGGDAALCQITLTTCFWYFVYLGIFGLLLFHVVSTSAVDCLGRRHPK